MPVAASKGNGRGGGVLVVGSLAFLPGVWPVVSGLVDAGSRRPRLGVTSLIVGATYFAVAWLLAAADTRDGSGELVLAVFVGGIPLLIGMALWWREPQ